MTTASSLATVGCESDTETHADVRVHVWNVGFKPSGNIAMGLQISAPRGLSVEQRLDFLSVLPLRSVTRERKEPRPVFLCTHTGNS